MNSGVFPYVRAAAGDHLDLTPVLPYTIENCLSRPGAPLTASPERNYVCGSSFFARTGGMTIKFTSRDERQLTKSIVYVYLVYRPLLLKEADDMLPSCLRVLGTHSISLNIAVALLC